MYAMSSKVKTYYQIVLIVCATYSAAAQHFNDQGMMSGTGVVFVPTTGIAPVAQFRVQLGRVEYLRKNLRGLNVFELNGGLSTNLEGYIKLYSEQTGTIVSATSFGIGGKFQMPFKLPLVEHLALWTESISSQKIDSAATFSQNILRGGISTGFRIGNFQPTLFAGIANVKNNFKPIGGFGILLPLNTSVMIGGELFYNYFYRDDIHESITGIVRLLPNISLQVSSGYTSSAKLKSWIITAGISVSTADLDFTPKAPQQPQMLVPPIEEMEKLSSQEKGIGQIIIDPANAGIEKKDEKNQDSKDDKKDDKQNEPKK